MEKVVIALAAVAALAIAGGDTGSLGTSLQPDQGDGAALKLLKQACGITAERLIKPYSADKNGNYPDQSRTYTRDELLAKLQDDCVKKEIQRRSSEPPPAGQLRT